MKRDVDIEVVVLLRNIYLKANIAGRGEYPRERTNNLVTECAEISHESPYNYECAW